MASPPPPGRQLTRQMTSRHAKVDEHGAEKVEPGCFTTAVGKRPCCACWLSFFIALFVGGIGAGSGRVRVEASGVASLDSDRVPEMVNFFSWLRGVDRDPNKYFGANVTETNPDAPLNWLFIYEGLSDGNNFFTVSNLEAMASVESVYLQGPVYGYGCTYVTNALDPTLSACAPPSTLLSFLRTNDALHRTQCLAGWCDATLTFGIAPAALETMCTQPSYAWGQFPCTSRIYDWRNGTLAPFTTWPTLLTTRMCNMSAPFDVFGRFRMQVMLPTNVVCNTQTLSSRYVRSSYEMATPVNGSQSTADAIQDFYDAHSSEIDTLRDDLYNIVDDFSATRLRAARLETSPSGSKTRNVIMGPLARGNWMDLGGALMQSMLTADMMLAIGSIMLVVIILIVNTQSALLMLAGMFEIIMSLPLAMFTWILIGQTKIGVMELIGLFLILCIGADDIFVFTDTWKESAFMPPIISGSLQTRFTWTFQRASSAMLTTTFTTFTTLAINLTSPFNFFKSFGLFNGFVVVWDYVLVLTWYASSVLALTYFVEGKCAPGRNWECSCCCPGDAEQKAEQERFSTKWMRDTFAPLLRKLRIPLVLLSIGFFVTGIVLFATQFREGDLRQFPDSHPFTKFNTIQRGEFRSAYDYKISTVVMYGLANPPVEFPSGINFFLNLDTDYDDRFRPRYANDPLRFDQSAQLAMVGDCSDFASRTSIVDNGEVYCILNELQAFDPHFPYATETELRAALDAFYASPRYAQLQSNFTSYNTYTGFIADGTSGISALWNSFNTTIPVTVQFVNVGDYAKNWKDATNAVCGSDAPCVMSDRAGLFSARAMVDEIARGAGLSIILSMVIAYLVLVAATGNALVPFLALFSIATTIIWTLLTNLLVGNLFTANFALQMVMVIGLAVDYSVHLVHFYNEAPGDRYEKTQHALHGVGISIVGGAVTTGGAAIPLMMAPNFVFFQMAGLFIFLTAVFGFFFTFFTLAPMLMVMGPTGEVGDLRAMYNKITGNKSEAPVIKHTTSTTDEEHTVHPI